MFLRRLVILLVFFTYSSVWAQASGGPADSASYAQIDYWPKIPKTLSNSVIFGLEAGFLVGIAAISGFRRNIRDNFDEAHLFRGLSYGLYAGIILGLYVTYGISDGSEPENPAPENQDSAYNVNKNQNVYQKNFLSSHLQLLPLIVQNKSQTKLDGLLLNMKLLEF